MVIEKEISYSINLSQDLLYIIFDSYISKRYVLHDEYTDFVDENDVRSRLFVDSNALVKCYKRIESIRKFVFVENNTLVPLIDRVSTEELLDESPPSKHVKRICKCRVYKDPSCPQLEIKFEHIYLNKNVSDKFDSLMAFKQITLLNLLQNKNENVTRQSHLGSDEILANLRLEYEYTEDIDANVLSTIAKIVKDIDEISFDQNISPLIPYTTILNNTMYRKFDHEVVLHHNIESVVDVDKWALKLDGVRGKGLITRNFIVVFMDDMQMFSWEINTDNVAVSSPPMFSINNVVAFQCELVDNETLYVTDLLHVFKYTYNNVTQYECSTDGYNIDAALATQTINWLNERYGERGYGDNGNFKLKFQRFFDPPLTTVGYSTVSTDGYVVLDHQKRYVKYKYVKTVELEYRNDGNFYTSTGPLLNYKLHVVSDDVQLSHGKIYEAAIEGDSISIIKFRPDRLVPN
uniref:Lef4 n=1 Tax=Malacosoma sp. alphabaculovirus TaxID=1881632 RepID=A0A1B1V5I3_9ABAC|nr:lef4 [Malacosoma sp. alphabaculovirus]